VNTANQIRPLLKLWQNEKVKSRSVLLTDGFAQVPAQTKKKTSNRHLINVADSE
jgi:hypothetical protein